MVQEVTSQSWLKRIINSLIGILFGIALIIGSFILIFWNEGYGLHMAQSIQQTSNVVINVPNTPVQPENNLKVIYISGLATTKEILHDPTLSLSVKAIKLDRKVAMLQWQEEAKTETEKEWGGSEKQTTTYTYKPVWSERLIDSRNFKETTGHQNPSLMPITSLHRQAQNVTVGDFQLPKELINKINEDTPVDLSNEDIIPLQKKLQKSIHHDEENLYVGQNPESPQIGDLKISVTQVLPQTVSIIAQQINKTLQPYRAPAGKTISLLTSGEISSQEMLHNAAVENQQLIWILRGISLLMMIIGFSLILKPLSVLADIIPFMGTLVSFGTGLIAVVIGIILWGIATGIAWFTFRPLWGIGLITLVLLIGYLLIHRKSKTLPAPINSDLK